MANKILKVIVDKAPPVCMTVGELEAQIKKIGQTPGCDTICLMIQEVKLSAGSDSYGRPSTPYLVFAPVDKNGHILDMVNVIGLLIPCPPICSDVIPISPETLTVLLG
jgi:hypothetical protein